MIRIVKLMQNDGIEMEHVTCHCTRHTFATRCIENGMPPQVLKAILGHSNLSMTMDLYIHVLPNTKHDEMQKIAGLF
jgi:integrase